MSGGPTVILFYTTMWGALPDGWGDMPPGFEVTTDRRRLRAADVVVFHVPTLLPILPLPRKRPGQIWVAWSAECEANYRRLRSRAFLSRFDLTMTYRLDSDVPALYLENPAFPDFEVALRNPAVEKTGEAPAACFVSSSIDRSRRRDYLRELARHMPVHHYGRFMRTHELERDGGRATKMEVIARYPFTLSFENAIARDYVTEKFFDALVAGSVPVYLGAPNIETFAPSRDCFINVADFSGPRALAEHLLALCRDSTAYTSLLEWKGRPFRPEFTRLLELQSRPPLVRLCERLQERTARA